MCTIGPTWYLLWSFSLGWAQGDLVISDYTVERGNRLVLDVE